MRFKHIKTIANVFMVILLLAVVGFCIYGFRAGLFRSIETMQAFILSAGAWAPALFLAVHVVQVVIPLLPGAVTLAAGVILFGPVYGFWYNYVGILIGSCINFFVARAYGQKFVMSQVSKRNWDRYFAWTQKGKLFPILFAVAMLLPGAPDDTICLIAGLTKMKWYVFLGILVVTKPPSILLYSLGLNKIVDISKFSK